MDSNPTEPPAAALPVRELPADGARIVPPPPPERTDEESLDVWGFRDTRFFINERGHIEVSGSRYELSGQELPALVPWVRQVMGVTLDRQDVHAAQYPPAVPPPRLHNGLLGELQTFLDGGQISVDPLLRLRHGHGHTLEEIYAIHFGRLDRVPDVVVFPAEEAQVERIVAAAARCSACVIPYGGGTNVSLALSCPSGEARTIVSLDLRRLNRVLWIDPQNHVARIQAGAVGRSIQQQLAPYGLTLGHEPDSVEFSTLGGWIATHASGMKKNRYGNIEDLVLDVTVVTAEGRLERATVVPRESVGTDPRRWILGSEGNLGIVTSAALKVFALPEVQRYDSLLFPSFEEGVAFLHDLARQGNVPASVRLVDNLQFQFSLALRARAVGWRATKRRFERWVVTHVRGFDPQRMVACTLVFEGRRTEVSRQQADVSRIARRHRGMYAGSENGRRGYQLTFAIAYIRDFILRHHIVGESFETSVPWTRVIELVDGVKRCIGEEHARRGLPGRPFLSARVTQVYETGACVYFYFGFGHKGVPDPPRVYAEIEHAARLEILRRGGSLSHHHGIGKIRERFLPEVLSSTALEWSRRLKRAVDPANLFGCGNTGLR